jgi:hypothetical protein
MVKPKTWSILTLLVLTSLRAAASDVVIGMEDDWSRIMSADNVSFREGRRGYLDAVLGDNEYVSDEDTDLLLHFNDSPIRDVAGRYAADADGAGLTGDYRWLGRGAAVFRRTDDTIRLHAGSESLFAPGRLWGDFTLEFWLYPANLEEGETVLLWMGSRWREDRPVGQEVRVSVANRTLTWSFVNFFLPQDQSELTVELRGRKSLIPRDWHHHMIRFDSDTGLLEYLVDGLPEDVTHVSATRREDGTVYFPYIGEASGRTVQLGVGFVGFLDELRLSRKRVVSPRLQRVSPRPGVLIAGPVDMGYDESRLTSISSEYADPGRSEVLFYYWLGDRRDTIAGEWVPFSPGRNLDPAPTGRYLHVRMDLLPGAPTDERPAVSWISVSYQEDEPPGAPATVVADPGNGSVRLDWSPVPEPDVAGYLVYYGTASGRYFGTHADAGPSPLDVGNVTSTTVDGLENGRLYYFAITAYDASRAVSRQSFSQEVTARPLVGAR